MINLISFVSYVKLFSSLSQWLFHCPCVRVVARKNSYRSNIKIKVSISSLLRNMFFHNHAHKKRKNLTMTNALVTSVYAMSICGCVLIINKRQLHFLKILHALTWRHGCNLSILPWTLDPKVWVCVQALEKKLCLSLSLFAQVYNWVPATWFW